MGVFFLFLLAVTLGSLSTLFWIPEDDLGRGYFQMIALVVLCLLALAQAVHLLHPVFEPFGDGAVGPAALTVALSAAFAYYACVWGERWRLGRWMVMLSLAATIAALILAGRQLVSTPAPLPYRLPLLDLALLASALLLGWSLVSMLLGHWYLIAPRLTFRHLIVFCWVLLAIVGLRIALIAASVTAALTAASSGGDPTAWELLAGFSGQGMFFWFRLLWGLAIPLALAAMSLHCARHGSNQSATGILYVLVVGTFIGEITGFYLTLTTGVPV